MIDHGLLVEKYRPKSLDDLVLSDDVRKKVETWMRDKDIPHLLLAGDPGCGKSTIAKILIDNLAPDTNRVINASNETGIDAIRTKVMNFAMSQSFGGIKICLLEEMDQLSDSAQKALKMILEDYSKHTRFIFTTNHVNRVNDAIQSRCQSLSFQPFTKKQMMMVLANIMVKEGIKGTQDQLELIVDVVGSDMRAAINKLQYASIDGNLTISKEMLVGSDIKFKILELLNQKKLTDIRQLLADELVRDFVPLYKFLFDRAEDIVHNDADKNRMLIAEYLYRDGSIADNEINFSAMCLNIMMGK